MTLLSADGLTIALRGAPAPTVADLAFSLSAGECLGIAGESGSGKTLSARALIGLLPPAFWVSGRVLFKGMDLLKGGDAAFAAVRGRGIAWIPQMASQPFDPLCPAGALLLEALECAFPEKRRPELKKRLLELIALLGFDRPEKAFSRYPHQLSGGEQQRLLVAGAAALEPDVLIADEPATALDAENALGLLRLLETVKARGTALIFISHDLALVSRLADQVLVMQRGRVAESGPVSILKASENPCTRELAAARRRISRRFREATAGREDAA